jgi:hypothetical protein
MGDLVVRTTTGRFAAPQTTVEFNGVEMDPSAFTAPSPTPQSGAFDVDANEFTGPTVP